MTRHMHWQRDLNKLLNDNKDREFEWGKWDCGIFAAQLSLALRDDGVDYTDVFGKYTTALGATRALRKAGYTDLREYLIHVCGEPVPTSHLWRGDIAFYEGCAGVNLGSYSLMLGVTPIGLDVSAETTFVTVLNTQVNEFFKVR